MIIMMVVVVQTKQFCVDPLPKKRLMLGAASHLKISLNIDTIIIRLFQHKGYRIRFYNILKKVKKFHLA